MSFRLVPNSVTLDDLERCNKLIALTAAYNFIEFGSYWGKLRKSSWRYTFTFCSLNVGQRIQFLAILAGDHPSESVKMRHTPLVANAIELRVLGSVIVIRYVALLLAVHF